MNFAVWAGKLLAIREEPATDASIQAPPVTG